ncbi:hypothetical protein PAXRUDRAFT_823477 [Paxillus rubicundulus Ve08.2h10]|uniref:MIT domain-containing protein n=1 Tax=Paxillus rubicundulus Ve08.2h10 TaxID=930991 RepID=A0A0D0E8U4_9AGAM|nr:hypothetical protein PAXRUDRAFT_823477 [Paxillus rubicundulus Ve08.2h10]
MVLEFSSRPLSVVHRSRQWHDHPSGPPAGLSPSPPPPPSAFVQSAMTQRRRSSTANFPPAAPPPSQPIPSLPMTLSRFSIGEEGASSGIPDDPHFISRHRSSISASQTTGGRPATSANLVAVTALSQNRHQQLSASTPASTSTSPQPSSTAVTYATNSDSLSDPPPKSMLQSNHSKTQSNTQDIVPDRLLLSPHEPHTPSESRPSSRRALTRALELAREAVQLDATNDDPHAAVIAYGRSVALLSEVMERVQRGEDSTEGRRKNGRRRSAVAQEEEVRRLQAIHDTYADRMNILSLIYSIPPIPHSPSSVYAPSTSTESTQPPSPTSLSPSSDSHRSSPYATEHTQDDPQHLALNGDLIDEQDAHEGIGSAMLNAAHLSQEISPSLLSQHPYATSDTVSSPTRVQAILNRTSTLPANRPHHQLPIPGRPRAASVLPPAAPPPISPPPPPPELSLPSAPASLPSQTNRFFEVTRPRGNSIGHKRTGSGTRLTSVTEEGVRVDSWSSLLQGDDSDADHTASLPRRPDTPRTAKRDSHPLPPLPSPTNAVHPFRTAMAPTAVSRPPVSPVTAQFVSSRPRGESMGVMSGQPLINSSIAMGTIHQRRNKMSAPPSTTTTASSSPTDSNPPSSFSQPRPKTPGSPPSSGPAPTPGRSRASSQPGRRPSVINGRISPFDPQHPPLPQTAVTNGRKVSSSSKLNPHITINVQIQPQFIVQSDLLSPPALTLVPPPAMLTNIPTTPTSPLPPAPPTDSQRKPYHMMVLLANTMTSRSGGYITRRLHVPQGVWSQGGAKLTNEVEKVRVVEVLCSALEEMQQSSVEFFGAGSVCSGLALGIGSVGRKEAEAWVGKLEEFSSICDSVVANFGKKLGVGEGFVSKKSGGVTSWGGKLTRQFDKFTNGKNLDSPAAYVAGLGRLFMHAQLLDEHSKALLSQPVAPIYAAFPADLRSAAEMKLKHASEFFASVVLTFVIRDLAQLLDKYAKKCEKWLAE